MAAAKALNNKMPLFAYREACLEWLKIGHCSEVYSKKKSICGSMKREAFQWKEPNWSYHSELVANNFSKQQLDHDVFSL